MGIRLLAEEVIAKIAAGEVIERPSSVVKELVENSLDAGATQVVVEIEKGGHRRIQVADNGSGIPSSEVELAFIRHATSKLQYSGDLEAIDTLGFRGEALASIAAVSQVTVVTNHRDEEFGTEVNIHGGELIDSNQVGVPQGTVITVENLFFNTPARLKFLKSQNTEKRHITSLVTRYAMAYPHTRFQLRHDGREVFRSNGSGDLGDVVFGVLGLENFKKMLEVRGEETIPGGLGAISVHGFVSEPSLSRNDRSRIILFVNGRSVQDNGLTHAVRQAYHTLLMKGRYPVAVLMITVPPEFVDVNVHPTKAEVRFQKADVVFVAVQRTVREAVVGFSGTRQFQPRNSSFSSPQFDTNHSWSKPEIPASHAPDQIELGLELSSPGQYPSHRQAGEVVAQSDDPTAIPVGVGQPEKPRTLPLLRVVGQIGAAYIVAEGPAGLYLIDQHAAHERIMYEKFMDLITEQEPVVQKTLDAETIDLPPLEARILEEKLGVLQAIGFHVEPFGANTFVLRGVPALLADTHNPLDVLYGVIQDLEADELPGQRTIEDKVITHVCKRASVKAGQILSYTEMQGIIQQLERCESPHTCPHGRPTMIHMSSDQLAREFGRLG